MRISGQEWGWGQFFGFEAWPMSNTEAIIAQHGPLITLLACCALLDHLGMSQ